MPKLKKYKVILDGKEREIKAGEKVYASIPVKVKAIDKENKRLTMVASTQDKDRHGDTILQDGWDLVPFQKNPVILNSHNYHDATEVIARAENIRVEGKGKKAKLVMDWVFAVDENPKAKVIFDLYAGGFLHASSVGFIPRKFAEDEDGNRDWFVIEEAELLEVSAVSVPANAMALAKQKGIDIDLLNHKKEQYDDEDDDDGDEPEDGDEPKPKDDDEIRENNENEEDDGEKSAGDCDCGKGKPKENDDEDDEDEQAAGDEDSDEDGESEAEEQDIEVDDEQEPEAAPKKLSYKQRIVKAIKRIETREEKYLRKVLVVLNSLASDHENTKNLGKKTQNQIRKRKVNQAIRMLNKIK